MSSDGFPYADDLPGNFAYHSTTECSRVELRDLINQLDHLGREADAFEVVAKARRRQKDVDYYAGEAMAYRYAARIAREASSRLAASAQELDGWSTDMSAAPKGPDNRLLVTVPSLHAGQAPIVGEAWFCTEDDNEGWWWGGTSTRKPYDAPIRETNAKPIAWRHMPKPFSGPNTNVKT